MNRNIVEGKWAEFKDELHRIWGEEELREDDLDRTHGNVKAIMGLIQEKFGVLEDETRERLCDLISRFGTDPADNHKTPPSSSDPGTNHRYH